MIDKGGDRSGHAGPGGCCRFGDKVRLTEHAVGRRPARLVRGGVETQHAVVGEIPHPEPPFGVEADADGIVEFGRIGSTALAGEIALAEHRFGSRAAGQAICHTETEDAMVGAVDHEELAADRIDGHAVGTIEMAGIGAAHPADKIGLAEDEVGGLAVAPFGLCNGRQQECQHQKAEEGEPFFHELLLPGSGDGVGAAGCTKATCVWFCYYMKIRNLKGGCPIADNRSPVNGDVTVCRFC
ncbi:MAG: hypothetical protein BWY77_01046 [bacterium ADurb.Bin431]|nr:MAG: hypothetical protein BWY77_01046 [bacterium ADurb.Bin431]